MDNQMNVYVIGEGSDHGVWAIVSIHRNLNEAISIAQALVDRENERIGQVQKSNHRSREIAFFEEVENPGECKLWAADYDYIFVREYDVI